MAVSTTSLQNQQHVSSPVLPSPGCGYRWERVAWSSSSFCWVAAGLPLCTPMNMRPDLASPLTAKGRMCFGGFFHETLEVTRKTMELSKNCTTSIYILLFCKIFSFSILPCVILHVESQADFRKAGHAVLGPNSRGGSSYWRLEAGNHNHPVGSPEMQPEKYPAFMRHDAIDCSSWAGWPKGWRSSRDSFRGAKGGKKVGFSSF